MTIYADIQTLEPGALVDLFSIDSTALGGSVEYFHGYTQVGTITWQAQAYNPWPIDTEGFEKTGDQQPVPKLRVGNVDGSISALCLAYDDLVGAIITHHRTLGKYLDAVNFPGGNPTADPTQELPIDTWFIERKSSEDNETVEFELSSALNFNGVQLPRRQIIANLCAWVAIGGYRGPFCGYTGGPVADINDNPTTDPTKDQCSGSLKACKMRFNGVLPFGGYPASGMTRT